MGISIGDTAPGFDLSDTEGQRHSLNGDRHGPTVIVFTCNHCPYALAWQDRIADAARDYAQRGVRFLAVNSNDAKRYPADSYQKMQQRVREEQWEFPYLHDESQQVARQYGAKVTPDVFVLGTDNRLRYRGAPDEDYNEPSHNAAWLRDALDALLEGRDPDPAETDPVGCSVKWRQ